MQLKARAVSGIIHAAVQDQWESVSACSNSGHDTAEGATPAIAQAHEPLTQANLESAA
jgi:hypothetical protein